MFSCGKLYLNEKMISEKDGSVKSNNFFGVKRYLITPLKNFLTKRTKNLLVNFKRKLYLTIQGGYLMKT